MPWRSGKRTSRPMPTAACTADREPAAIARELARRVVNHANGVALTAAIEHELAERCAKRILLAQHLATLREQHRPGRVEIPQHQGGPGLRDGWYSKAELWVEGHGCCELYATGTIRRTMPVEVNVNDWRKLAALLAKD